MCVKKFTKEAVAERIDKYLQKKDWRPRLVNANNPEDLDFIRQRFFVDKNIFKTVSDFSKTAEGLSEEELYHFLAETRGTVFLTGFASYFRLIGKEKLQEFIHNAFERSYSDLHLVVVCYQCEQYLNMIDRRYLQFVYAIQGEEVTLPQIVFVTGTTPVPEGEAFVEGVQRISEYVEKRTVSKLFVRTEKSKSSYPRSCYTVNEFNIYDVLCDVDESTLRLKKGFGEEREWELAFNKISQHGSWEKYVLAEFGTTTNLENIIGSWSTFDSSKKWFFFIALKLYGVKKNWCLTVAINNAEKSNHLIRWVFRSLLTLSHNDKEFWDHYEERKNLIHLLGNSKSLDAEASDYCAMVKSKGMNALYYLTDASKRERNLIFEILANYSEEIGREKVIDALGHVYPDLYSYLQPYRFDVTALNLDGYFQEYKYQKVVNKIFPDFLERVNEQAEKREFNLLLPTRSEKLDSIEKNGTVLYFMDAMGVEYLSFIMDQCRKRKLTARVDVCRCELPSITLFNKEFVDVFVEGGAVSCPDKNGIKKLDDLKHHGEEEFDFTNNEIPTYISKEFEIISQVIENIATSLCNGDFKRAVMIADHGASRLCVLARSENQWGSESNAEHSGRCCPVNEIDAIPSCATEENGYWVLANYDRFEGSRRANIEVHGGATLEEVVVPIIEMVFEPDDIEIQLLDTEVKFSRRKKNAALRVFSKTKLDNLRVRVLELNVEYVGNSTDGQTFTIALPGLSKAGKYTIDVFHNNNPLKHGLKFTACNTDFSERKLL